MIQADIDPSLRAAEPLLESLDDGFSPPARDDDPLQGGQSPSQHPAELGAKSPF